MMQNFVASVCRPVKAKINNILLVISLLFCIQLAHSQSNSYRVITNTDNPPKLKYKGGLEKFISDSITWPASFDGIGNVVVLFTVSQNGCIENIRITQKLCPNCDDEAIRILKKSPRWQAGKLNKKKIDVEVECTIRFQINE